MGKSQLQETVVKDAAAVEEAAAWAKRMTQLELRGHGDMDNAWHRLEARYGIPWRYFWSLRFRRPKGLTVEWYYRLRAAYEAECERQMRKLKNEAAITKAIAGPDCPAVRAAEALLRKAEE